jgi:LuxR family quorum-sensing system transcriptional regulator CciR
VFIMPDAGTEGFNIERSGIRLTDMILGFAEQELSDTLKAIASEIGIRHISFLPFETDKGVDAGLCTTVSTYSNAWQTRYFAKDYIFIDPVVKHGRTTILPFDWEKVRSVDPAELAFFADAAKHGVGRNGVTIPVQNRRGRHALVSFTNDRPRMEWEQFKRESMTSLKRLSTLIDTAADAASNQASPSVTLSPREEQCLVWAARGKSPQEIAQIMKLASASVKAHLDTARHKLYCMNLRHAIAVAVATGAIPATSLQ